MHITRKIVIVLLIIFVLIFNGCSNKEFVKEVLNELDNISNNTNNTDNFASEELIIHYIDVGQADSILIEFPTGEIALIDGGNRGDSDKIINYIDNLNISSIDYLIATHPHEDHIGGLPNVIEKYNIKNIYMPRKSTNTKIYLKLLETIKAKGNKIHTADGFINIIDMDNLKFQILAPNSDDYNETNDYSIVNKIVYKNNSFLFTGDAEKDSEMEILDKNYNVESDVLKIGHHGGRTSSNIKFLQKVNPKYAIISCGSDNEYGHPHDETIKRLENLDVKIYRTDKDGTITVYSNGQNITINSEY